MNIPRGIKSDYKSRAIGIYRAIVTKDAVGSAILHRFTAYADVLAEIQPESSVVEQEIHGLKMYQTHKCYFDRFDTDSELNIKPGDLLLDKTFGERHWILSIEKHEPFTRRAFKGGFYKLILATTNDIRYAVINNNTLRARARIHPHTSAYTIFTSANIDNG